MCNETAALTAPLLANVLQKIAVKNFTPMLSSESGAIATDLLSRYAILPLDSAASCSGCRTLTDALNNLDEARHAVVALRGLADPKGDHCDKCASLEDGCGHGAAKEACMTHELTELRDTVRAFRKGVMRLAAVCTEEEVQRFFPAAIAEATEDHAVVGLLQLVINTKGV